MLKLIADENFNRKVVRGLRRKQPALDIIRVQEVGLSGMPDPELLEWAATEDRLLLTHDTSTMTKYAYERARSGQTMPGVIEVAQQLSIARAIEEILVLANCSFEGEWEGQVIFVPLH